jgi:radical SAM protein with 4Fe4S-binding SPASM domain
MTTFSSINDRIRGLWGKSDPMDLLTPGIHHFLHEENGNKSQIHLRVEKDGNAVLLINASRLFHLNPSAAWMAYQHLHQSSTEKAVSALTRQFHVSKIQARQDYAAFIDQLNALIDPDGPCPICDLELETTMPFSSRPSAPYRMDLAITYRCNNLCAHCYNDRTRHIPELDTVTWKNILDQLWTIGIPHVVFTGGEPTLRNDLPELIAHAQNLGMVAGLNTNGRRLSDPVFVQSLVDAGLDHVQITLESHDPAIHNLMVASQSAWGETVAGIRNALTSRLFVMTNTTLLVQNSPFLDQTLDFLAETGVPTIGLNALIYSGQGALVGTGLPETALEPLLQKARSLTERNNQRLIWYTPTQYCHFDPIQMDLGVKGCTAALYNMCIEPDGNVIPCQSYYSPLGNLQLDSWETIWNHPLAISLRERHNLPEKCTLCSFISECGGGCPLTRQDNLSPLEIFSKP